MIRTLRTRITLTYVVIAVLAVLLTGWVAYRQIHADEVTRLVSHLQSHIRVVQTLIAGADASGTPARKVEELLHQTAEAAGIRITLIDAFGNVLFESRLPDSARTGIENHLARPEIIQAQSTGTGVATRTSSTIHAPLLYAARHIDPLPASSRYPNLAFIRAATSLAEVEAMERRLRLSIVAAALIGLIAVSGVGYVVSGRISRPLEEIGNAVTAVKEGNYMTGVHIDSRDELGRLANLVNEMTRRLRSDDEELKRLQTVRSQFLANVSHELRTPLFSLKGFLETLLEGGMDDAAVRTNFLQKASAQANRLDQLLTDLIDISKIESGEMKPSLRVFDARAMLEEVVAEFTDQAAARKQKLTLEVPTAEPGVIGDRQLLTHVLHNLLQNALRYSHDGSTVTVSAVPVPAGMELAVTDNGPGIAEEHIPRIFERFYRVDANRSREIGGTGLGLAIVKHIVEAHGSRMNVASAIGKGSRFSFILRTA